MRLLIFDRVNLHKYSKCLTSFLFIPTIMTFANDPIRFFLLINLIVGSTNYHVSIELNRSFYVREFSYMYDRCGISLVFANILFEYYTVWPRWGKWTLYLIIGYTTFLYERCKNAIVLSVITTTIFTDIYKGQVVDNSRYYFVLYLVVTYYIRYIRRKCERYSSWNSVMTKIVWHYCCKNILQFCYTTAINPTFETYKYRSFIIKCECE